MTDLDFTGYHETLKALVILAKDLGWEVRQTHSTRKGHGGIRLTAPDSPKTVSVPRSTQMRDGALKSIANQIARYSDPERLAAALSVMDAVIDKDLPSSLRAELVTTFTPHSGLAMIGEPVSADPGPVHTRPSKYDNVLEVVQDDEVLAYRCAHCGYEKPTPTQVAVHAAQKKDKAHGHAEPERKEKKDARPPTDGEILESIRRIVGTSGSEVESLRSKVETLEKAVAHQVELRRTAEEHLASTLDRAVARAEQAEQRAQAAEDNLQALRDLLLGVTS